MVFVCYESYLKVVKFNGICKFFEGFLAQKEKGFLDSLTFSGLAKVAIFTTNVDAENQTLINHKCVCGALNRHFCQTRVIGSFFFPVVHSIAFRQGLNVLQLWSSYFQILVRQYLCL